MNEISPTDEPKGKTGCTIYGVVAVLMILAFTMVLLSRGGPLKMAFKTSTNNKMQLISIACESYKTEYGTLPPTSENYLLKKVLSGENPRGIPFISLKTSDVNPNGEMIDPWQTPFRITFGADSSIRVLSAGPDKIFRHAE